MIGAMNGERFADPKCYRQATTYHTSTGIVPRGTRRRAEIHRKRVVTETTIFYQTDIDVATLPKLPVFQSMMDLQFQFHQSPRSDSWTSLRPRNSSSSSYSCSSRPVLWLRSPRTRPSSCHPRRKDTYRQGNARDRVEGNAFHYKPKACSYDFLKCSMQPQDFKEFVDAENLMPLATSDFRNPVCMEMRNLKGEAAAFAELDARSKPLHFQYNNNNNNNNNNNGDMGSMDSSDTFASCNTHPFYSQGDLTSEVADPSCAIDSNLYVNPLDKSGENSPDATTAPAPAAASVRPAGVKKSASGDTALRSLATSPMDDHYREFSALDRGSRVSLNESPLPKQSRRTRFQQSHGSRPKTRFGDALERDSQESLEKKKRTSFIPTRGLASATRIINQHLFGIQNLGGSRTGKNCGSKSSLSVDSIDSRASPQLDHHRRSKSILKKSDSSGYRSADPESERLISDNTSSLDVGSGSEYSPNKRLSSPPLSQRSACHRRLTRIPPPPPPYQQQEVDKNRTMKSPLFLLDDIMNSKDKQTCNEQVVGNKYSVVDVPLYICPPPPPMEDHSPTEETRLLLHTTTSLPPNVQMPANSVNNKNQHTS